MLHNLDWKGSASSQERNFCAIPDVWEALEGQKFLVHKTEHPLVCAADLAFFKMMAHHWNEMSTLQSIMGLNQETMHEAR